MGTLGVGWSALLWHQRARISSFSSFLFLFFSSLSASCVAVYAVGGCHQYGTHPSPPEGDRCMLRSLPASGLAVCTVVGCWPAAPLQSCLASIADGCHGCGQRRSLPGDLSSTLSPRSHRRTQRAAAGTVPPHGTGTGTDTHGGSWLLAIPNRTKPTYPPTRARTRTVYRRRPVRWKKKEKKKKEKSRRYRPSPMGPKKSTTNCQSSLTPSPPFPQTRFDYCSTTTPPPPHVHLLA